MSDRIVVRLSNLGVSYRRKKGFMRHEYFWALKNIDLKEYSEEHKELKAAIDKWGY